MKRRLIDVSGLKAKGINYSKSQRNRMIKAGRFPRPVRPGKGRVLWIEDEVDQYIDQLISTRDTPQDAAA